MRFKRPGRLALVAPLFVAVVACGGSAVKKDAKRLKSRCDVVRGSAVTEDQARCIAGIYGVKHTKSCPMEVDRPVGFSGPVFRVLESCNGLGVIVEAESGRVLDIVARDVSLLE
jgi:hypothetical protein